MKYALINLDVLETASPQELFIRQLKKKNNKVICFGSLPENHPTVANARTVHGFQDYVQCDASDRATIVKKMVAEEKIDLNSDKNDFVEGKIIKKKGDKEGRYSFKYSKAELQSTNVSTPQNLGSGSIRLFDNANTALKETRNDFNRSNSVSSPSHSGSTSLVTRMMTETLATDPSILVSGGEESGTLVDSREFTSTTTTVTGRASIKNSSALVTSLSASSEAKRREVLNSMNAYLQEVTQPNGREEVLEARIAARMEDSADLPMSFLPPSPGPEIIIDNIDNPLPRSKIFVRRLAGVSDTLFILGIATLFTAVVFFMVPMSAPAYFVTWLVSLIGSTGVLMCVNDQLAHSQQEDAVDSDSETGFVSKMKLAFENCVEMVKGFFASPSDGFVFEAATPYQSKFTVGQAAFVLAVALVGTALAFFMIPAPIAMPLAVWALCGTMGGVSVSSLILFDMSYRTVANPLNTENSTVTAREDLSLDDITHLDDALYANPFAKGGKSQPRYQPVRRYSEGDIDLDLDASMFPRDLNQKHPGVVTNGHGHSNGTTNGMKK